MCITLNLKLSILPVFSEKFLSHAFGTSEIDFDFLKDVVIELQTDHRKI